MAKKPPFDAASYLQHMAAVAGINVSEESRPVVISHLETAARMAVILDQVPLDPNSIELAGVFRAGANDD